MDFLKYLTDYFLNIEPFKRILSIHFGIDNTILYVVDLIKRAHCHLEQSTLYYGAEEAERGCYKFEMKDSIKAPPPIAINLKIN